MGKIKGWKVVEINKVWTGNTITVKRWKHTKEDYVYVEVRKFMDKRSHPYMYVTPQNTMIAFSKEDAFKQALKYMRSHPNG